jgi:hypothetical protein
MRPYLRVDVRIRYWRGDPVEFGDNERRQSVGIRRDFRFPNCGAGPLISDHSLLCLQFVSRQSLTPHLLSMHPSSTHTRNRNTKYNKKLSVLKML